MEQKPKWLGMLGKRTEKGEDVVILLTLLLLRKNLKILDTRFRQCFRL